MAKKPDKCPKCGGGKRGRGYTHIGNCSEATGKNKGKGTPPARKGDLLDLIDGRTKLSTLLRLQTKIEELLTDKDKGEIKKVRDALANVEKLRAELAEAESLIA